MSIVDVCEFLAFVVLSIGVGLALGTFNVVLGVGGGLIVFALCALLFLLAYERGS